MAKIRQVYDDGKLKHYHFFCPACDEVHAFNGTWDFNQDFECPTISPSLRVTGNRDEVGRFICHSFISDGTIEFLKDCTHDMAGKVVDLPDFRDD
jgi:hypothetical protein